MEKVLKVCKAPQGKKYVPSVRIAGDYLEKFNFNLDDNVIVKIENNKITIEKAEKESLLAFLCRKNASLPKLIENLSLTLL